MFSQRSLKDVIMCTLQPKGENTMTVSTLLEDIETSRRTPPFSSYREYLDTSSPGSSLASNEFYEKIDFVKNTHFTNRLADCRSRAWFIRNKETGLVRVAAKQCRLRWCYHCSEARQQFITQAVLPWFEKSKQPKLLTLTLKHNFDPLTEQIDFLYSCFVKFRNRKFVKTRIHGGVWFFQITYNQKSEQWHPHLHCLLDSEYLDHSHLKVIWEKITRGSQIVHIRAVHNPKHTLEHNARYAARPGALVKIPKHLWFDMFESFDGRRICGSWGNARCISLRPQKPEDAHNWQSIGGFKTVLNLLKTSDSAKNIWNAWQLKISLEPNIDMNDIDNFIEGIRQDERPPPDWELEPFFKWDDYC